MLGAAGLAEIAYFTAARPRGGRMGDEGFVLTAIFLWRRRQVGLSALDASSQQIAAGGHGCHQARVLSFLPSTPALARRTCSRRASLGIQPGPRPATGRHAGEMGAWPASVSRSPAEPHRLGRSAEAVAASPPVGGCA